VIQTVESVKESVEDVEEEPSLKDEEVLEEKAEEQSTQDPECAPSLGTEATCITTIYIQLSI